MAIYIIEERLRKLLRVYPVGTIRLLREFYYEDLYTIARKITGNHRAALYVVNAIFLILHLNYKNYDKYKGFTVRHYLVRTLRSKAITWYCWCGVGEKKAKKIVMEIEISEANF